jgi:hypothetical protein
MIDTKDATWNDFENLWLPMVACRDYPHNPIEK